MKTFCSCLAKDILPQFLFYSNFIQCKSFNNISLWEPSFWCLSILHLLHKFDMYSCYIKKNKNHVVVYQKKNNLLLLPILIFPPKHYTIFNRVFQTTNILYKLVVKFCYLAVNKRIISKNRIFAPFTTISWGKWLSRKLWSTQTYLSVKVPKSLLLETWKYFC